MHRAAVLCHAPKHKGSGRICSLVNGSVANLEPPELGGEKYVLVIAAAPNEPELDLALARRWIEAGASYICAWGETARKIEDTFDYAAFVPEVGQPLSWTLMTTQHSDEQLEQALWFAFYCAVPPDDLIAQFNRVVIVAGTPLLAKACMVWLQANAE